jgi:hypothetical protein
MADSSQVCSDLSEFPNGRCVPLEFDAQTGHRTNGSLIGVCEAEDDTCSPACSAGETCVDGDCRTVLSVWDACDDQSNVHTCPPQTLCMETDAFAASPTGNTHCIPYCDTDHSMGPEDHCLDLGAQVTGGATPLCTSWSQAYGPHGPNDVRQSRVGLCLVP